MTSIRGGIQNFPDWCRHLYSSCGSAKYWWMVGLPCLVSHCAKLHIAGHGQFSHTFVWSHVRDLWRFSWWIRERNSECAPHTDCSFLWSIVKIATGHVHGSKQTRVKTVHVHPAKCNLARWLTRHSSPTIHRCFALPQLLYRWRHQSGKFWIAPCTAVSKNTYSMLCLQFQLCTPFHSQCLHYPS
jgi:hypothetical protein